MLAPDGLAEGRDAMGGIGPPVPKRVKWIGDPPDACDVCGKPTSTSFIDGLTHFGAAAFMCDGCHEGVGMGLGTGLGQRFEFEPDGEFIKTAG